MFVFLSKKKFKKYTLFQHVSNTLFVRRENSFFFKWGKIQFQIIIIIVISLVSDYKTLDSVQQLSLPCTQVCFSEAWVRV